ncbi:MAG: TVP38/TMEM64 family protein [Christensenellales bacterium]|jgi:uncharacterized membrane protein YdjX (TVP38/TMEM64 family)
MDQKTPSNGQAVTEAEKIIDTPPPAHEDADYQRRRQVVSVISIIVLIAFLIGTYFVVGKPLLATVENPEHFRAWVSSHGILGYLAMIGIMALQVIFAIIPGEPMEVGAGYAFGAWGGMVLCLLGAFLGQLIIFFFVRKYGVRLVEAFVSREKMQSVKFLNDNRKLELLTFVLFLIPGTPKDVLSYVAGLLPINMWRFLILTTIARIPSVITSTVVGSALGDGKTKTAIIVFVVTAIVSALGVLAYRIYSKNKSAESSKKQSGEEAEQK